MPPHSILARYLAREILQTTAAVTLVLLLIFLSGRFSKYLIDAATGKIAADIILQLLFFRAPNILERILPLGLFLGILLVYGRLYVENEITALHAAGISVPQLFRASWLAILPVALITGSLAFYVSPAGFQQVERMLNREKKRSELDLVEAGKFLPLRATGGAVYTGKIGEGRQTMSDVFLAEQHMDGQWTILRADSGLQHYDEASDQRYLTLNNGVRYTFFPGQAEGERLRFTSLQQRVRPSDAFDPRKLKEDTLSTSFLWQEADNASYMATLEWRASLVILVPLVAMLAVAMSRTTPRQGRYIKLLPAMLLYFTYMTALDVLRHKVAERDLLPMPGMLSAHLLFLMVALLFLYSDRLVAWRRRA
jgi:lipopolysaccharide export system permease protein